MPHLRFIFLSALTFLSFNLKGQKPSCSGLEQGLFFYYSNKSSDYVFIREEGLQKEINLATGDTSLWNLEWKSNCTYLLSYVSGGHLETLQKSSGKTFVFAVKIMKTTSDYYVYSSYMDKLGGTLLTTDTLWLKKQQHRTTKKELIEAAFPGGEAEWQTYISGMISSNEKVLQGIKKTTTSYFGFVLDTDGSISNIKALGPKRNALTKIAIEAIQKGPNWTPATINGLAVKAFRLQPVTFQVQ